MKYLLNIILIFSTFQLFSKDFELIFNSTGSYKKNEMIFLDKSKISLNIYNSEWTDNYGNYGIANCLTSIKYNENDVIKYLDSFCRYTDQNRNIFTQHNSRKDNEFTAGVGKAVFIEGQKKWKYLKGSECLYSIKYFENRTFSIRKCKITEDMHNQLVNKQ